jgi:large subunit ribosomal protein L21
MYAIVEISGKQYKVEKDALVNVDRLDKKENEDITVDKVVLFSNGDNVLVGAPYLSNVKVLAKVMGEVKAKKVRGVRFKRRKNFTRTIGSRAQYSQLKISDVVLS